MLALVDLYKIPFLEFITHFNVDSLLSVPFNVRWLLNVFYEATFEVFIRL